MSTRPLHGIRIAIVALATLASTVPLLKAQTAEQIYLDSLLTPKTILTASAKVLATTVATAITSNTNGYTAAELASAAYTQLGGKVRADRETSAATVVEAAIAALSGTSPTYATDVASLVDAVVDVNPGDTKEDLSTAGQTAVVKGALGTLSDLAAASSTSLLAADAAIGATLASDAYLGNLAKGALSTILDGAIAGINGTKGKSTTVAPEAAQDFIGGIVVSGSLPNVNGVPTPAAYGSFAVAILKSVSKNTSVDEAGAYSIALVDGTANDVSLATALYAKYAAAQAKITQGIAATIGITGTNDSARTAFVGAATTANVKDAVTIDQGATFVDPYHADSFTGSVFNAVIAAPGGTKLIDGDATKIATAVGETLGSDGDELTDVAVTYQDFIAAGSLPAASAATYAADLINGAFTGLPKTTIYAYSAAAVGDGGQLNGGKTGITASSLTQATADDLAAIVDALATGVLASNDTAAKIASDIGALVKSVATLTKNGTISGTEVDVAAFLAGSLASTVASSADQAVIDAAIDSSLKSVVSKTVFGSASTAGTVAFEVATPTYETVGAITFAETAVTNL